MELKEQLEVNYIATMMERGRVDELERLGVSELIGAANEYEKRVLLLARDLDALVMVRRGFDVMRSYHHAIDTNNGVRPYAMIGSIVDELGELVALHELGHMFHEHHLESHGYDDDVPGFNLRHETEAWTWALEQFVGDSGRADVVVATLMLCHILWLQTISVTLPGNDSAAWALIEASPRIDVSILPNDKRADMEEELSELKLAVGAAPAWIVKALKSNQGNSARAGLLE